MNLIKTAAALSVAVAMGMTSAMAQSLPDFPVTIKSASGAMTDGVIYAGLGTAGKSWYKIDTKAQDPKWEEVASFPGDARDQSQSVALNGKIYVFGGCGKSSATGLTTVFNDVWAYDPANDSWEKVMTRSPFGMTGHSAITVDCKNAIVLGSVNKAIFDGYFEDLQTAAGNDELLAKVNADYSNKPVEDYYFNREVMQYNPETNMWSSLGQMPTTGTAGAADTAVLLHATVYSSQSVQHRRADRPARGTRARRAIPRRWKSRPLPRLHCRFQSIPDTVPGNCHMRRFLRQCPVSGQPEQ